MLEQHLVVTPTCCILLAQHPHPEKQVPFYKHSSKANTYEHPAIPPTVISGATLELETGDINSIKVWRTAERSTKSSRKYCQIPNGTNTVAILIFCSRANYIANAVTHALSIAVSNFTSDCAEQCAIRM